MFQLGIGLLRNAKSPLDVALKPERAFSTDGAFPDVQAATSIDIHAFLCHQTCKLQNRNKELSTLSQSKKKEVVFLGHVSIRLLHVTEL